jgi:DNA polymerase I-like protein with 3'-5' exonuclease and polymerase domains
MTLLIWTSAESERIKKTFGKSLLNFKPDVPPHKIVPFQTDQVPDVPAGSVCLAAGNKCVDLLRVSGLVHKSMTINKLRGQLITATQGGVFMVTNDPGIISNEPWRSADLDWDLRLAVRYLKTGGLKPAIGKYQWVTSFSDMIVDIMERVAKTGKPVDVATDLETMGFHPWYPDKDIVSISFTPKAGESYVLYTNPYRTPHAVQGQALDPDLFEQIKWLLTSPQVKLRLANGKFDMMWIAEKWGIECTNFKFDSLLVGSLLDENRVNSLNGHAKTFTDFGGYDEDFNATYDKGRMELIPVDHPKPCEDFLVYAGGDTDACYQAADILRDELIEDPQLAKFYITIVQPAARAFEKMERRGVLVDQEAFANLRTEVSTVIHNAEQTALKLLPKKMTIKYREKIEDQLAKGKSPLLPSILKEFFFTPNGLNLKPKEVTPKTGEPTTKQSHLKMFEDVPEAIAFCKILGELEGARKTRSTFIDGFLKHLRPDGRFHPSYMLFHGGFNDEESDESGSVTGRLSAKEPAFQTIPKKTAWGKKLRACYTAPPGKVILALDYAQGELKIVACIAPEPTMIKAYQAGLDMHAVTGAGLADIELELFLSYKNHVDKTLAAIFDSARDRAKPANFGLLYGMSAEGFQGFAWASYGKKFTLKECEDIREKFFKKYPGLLDYHANMKKLANLHQQVRSPLGRIRHVPHIKSWDKKTQSDAVRQAINAPVQACLTDMMIWAIALIEDAYPNGEFETFGVIHDAMYAYVDADKADLRIEQAKAVMENLPLKELGWNPILPFTADGKCGANLAQV